MTFSFNVATLATTPKDQVRSLVGDTDPTAPLIDDEVIALYVPGGVLAQPDVYRAAVIVAKGIAGHFSRLADSSVGDVKVSLQQKAQGYLKLAKEWAETAVTASPPLPFAGGVHLSDKWAAVQDVDLVRPEFTRTTGDDTPTVEQAPQSMYTGVPWP